MNTSTSAKFLRPASTIVEKADGYIIEADMPGVTRDGLAITVKDDTLTITGRRTKLPVNARALHRERTNLDYERSFELGREIDSAHVSARLEQGVLQIFLPKAEALKPRRIEVAG